MGCCRESMPLCQLSLGCALPPLQEGGGYRAAGSSSSMAGEGRRSQTVAFPVQGHLCCVFGLLVGVLSGGYIPMLSTSTLRDGEGELNPTQYKDPLGARKSD